MADNLGKSFSKKYKIWFLERIIMHTRFSPSELEEFCGFLKQEFGLSFSSEKYQQLENRIQPILKSFSIRKLCDVIIESKKDIRLRMDLVNALTTNETWFFRHPSHFRILTRHIMPVLSAKREKTGDNRLKIWSAGCSIGAETFSILFSLLDSGGAEKWNLTLIGSDISSEAINRARSGRYFKHELKMVEPHILQKYFTPCDRDCYQVKEEYRQMVEFEILNLLESWPARKFDVIFCRNVMIYFDQPTQEGLVNRYARSLVPGGHLMIGHSESLNGIDQPLTYVEPTIYRRD